MTDKVQKIRKEVKRLKSQLLRGACSSQIAMETRCKEEAYDEVLSMLDTLQEEPVREDLEQAIDTYLATYFGSEQEKQDWPFLKKMAIHFAEWQKEQLMSKAIDGEVGYWNLRGLSINTDLPRSVSEGDKVKIIVIKED